MLEQLANLHKLCFPHRPWSADDFADLKKSGCEIISSDNGFIVWRTVANESEIITLGVAPGARRTGIASALLGLMERDIRNKEQGTRNKIFLEVASDNTAAMDMYEKCGYKQIAIRPKYYKSSISDVQMIDAIVMEKTL